jgi:predicted nicotinamide N-methyase
MCQYFETLIAEKAADNDSPLFDNSVRVLELGSGTGVTSIVFFKVFNNI